MKHFKKGLFIGLLIIIFSPNFAYPCSTFRIDHDNQFYFGKNFDWYVGNAVLTVNKRGIKKIGFNFGGEHLAGWTSKYGSVTFDRSGPTGGMNEAGLVVEAMLLPGTMYPEMDSRPALLGWQDWIQYQLDNHSTVDEVIASDSKIRIARDNRGGCHFLASDLSGKCAVIEFLEGKMVVYTGETLPVMALTNSRYAESLDYWEKGVTLVKSFSITRFIRIANMVSEYGAGSSGPPVDYAFDILSRVSRPSRTQWSIVYDQNNLRLFFITATNKKVRTVDLNKIDFSCRTPVKVLDANTDLAGDVTDKFQDSIRDLNRRSLHPDSMTCEE